MFRYYYALNEDYEDIYCIFFIIKILITVVLTEAIYNINY